MKKYWHHSGIDSFDNPEIQPLGKGVYRNDLQWGPYPTFDAAKKDLVQMIESDIQNLKDLLRHARALKKESK